MTLRPIDPGLRSMVNPSHDVAKVSLVVPAGDVVTVSDEVAGQLERQGFKPAAPAQIEVKVEAIAPSVDAGAEVLEAIKAGKGKKG